MDGIDNLEMNEWGYPTIYLESVLFKIYQKIQEKNFRLLAIVMTGGFSFEDNIFKGLALGASYVKLIGIGRATMAAAMVGETLEKQYKKDICRLFFLNLVNQYLKYSVVFQNSEQGLMMRRRTFQVMLLLCLIMFKELTLA